MRIACLGSGSGVAGEPSYDAMVLVGRLLAQAGHTVLTGGYGGAGMEAPARGAKEASGAAIGFTMLGKPGNGYLTEAVDSRLQYVNTTMNSPTMPPPAVQFGIRLGNLLSADGFIIAAGGGPGSMVELMAIINLGGKIWPQPKKVAILRAKVTNGGGWDYAMLTQLEDWGMLPQPIRSQILITESPEQAVNWATMVATAPTQDQGPQPKL